MNLIIRIAQVLLTLSALDNVYSLALLIGFSDLSGDNKLTSWNILGSLVSAAIFGFIVFLLQRYYEARNQSQTVVSGKSFSRVAIVGAVVVGVIGFLIPALLIILPWFFM